MRMTTDGGGNDNRRREAHVKMRACQLLTLRRPPSRERASQTRLASLHEEFIAYVSIVGRRERIVGAGETRHRGAPVSSTWASLQAGDGRHINIQ